MKSASKRFRLGTHRTCAPEETWERIAPLLPHAGVTRVADLTRLDRLGIPVYQAVRPASRNLAVSQGKGATPAAARVSAAMEALEIWHAERLDGVRQTRLSLREMRSANPIPLAGLRWQPGVQTFDAAPLLWMRAEPLRGGRPGWLPRQMVELDFRLPRTFEPQMFLKTSNGLASGNCREEALLHGLCELIERQGLARFLKDRTSAVPLDPGPCDLIDRCRTAGARLAFWDATWEAGVPVIVCELALPDLPVTWRGSGCHPSPEVALSRALTEAAQSRLTYISGARDDLVFEGWTGPPDLAWERFVETKGGRRLSDLPDLSTDGVGKDLDRVLESLGREAWAVDLTREEMGVPVFYTFVPGLEEPPHD